MITFCAAYVAEMLLRGAEQNAELSGAKQISYNDVRKMVVETPGLAFLEDTIPQVWVNEWCFLVSLCFVDTTHD